MFQSTNFKISESLKTYKQETNYGSKSKWHECNHFENWSTISPIKLYKNCKICETAPRTTGILSTKRSVRSIRIEKRCTDQFNDGTAAGRGGRRRRNWRSTNTLQCVSVLSEKRSAIPCRHSDSEDLKMKRYTERIEWRYVVSLQFNQPEWRRKREEKSFGHSQIAPSRDLSWQ